MARELSDDNLRRFFERYPPDPRVGTSLLYNVYDSTPAPNGTGGKAGLHMATCMGPDGPWIAKVICHCLAKEAERLGCLRAEIRA